MGMRRPSGLIAASAVAALALVLVSSTPAPANTTPGLPPGSIVPTDRQRAIARDGWARSSKKRTSAALPLRRQAFRAGVRALSRHARQPAQLFLASDITEFATARLKFDDMIRTGELEARLRDLRALPQQRNKERINYALSLLKTEPNWTVNESFQFDREHAPWPATQDEMNELWRKRIKNDALSLLLTGKSWKEASELLQKPL